MSDTVPPDIARRIRAETDLALTKAANEREFREQMLQTVTRMDVKLDHITERMQQHEQDDERRFAGVTQSINGTLTLKQIGWTMAGITFTIGAFWGIMELVSRIKP